MVRADKKKKEVSTDPEAQERKRLKDLGFSKNILSAKPGLSNGLAPSKTVIKHHGKDILKKSQRKNRYLFSFPGLLGPISGGKIGELKNLGTKNPILYLEFPQGQMKLFGTIVYPKNRYLTLQFSKSGKSVACEDYFDTMVVFSDAWWIGKKDENPEELRLDFPKELHLEQRPECDFTGGAGASCDGKKGSIKYKEDSPVTEVEHDVTDSGSDLKEVVEVTPTRHSARRAGKKFNFAESGSEDEATSEGEGEKADIKLSTSTRTSKTTENSTPMILDIDDEEATKGSQERKRRTTKPEVEDDVEESSDTSKDLDASDEDWTA